MIWLAFVLAILGHEAGHVAVAKNFGYRWKLILNWKKIAIRILNSENLTDKHNILIALAGPVASSIMASIGFLIGWDSFMWLNIFFGITSLFPIKGLDGYWIWKSMFRTNMNR
jgi:Zn-dependent protease